MANLSDYIKETKIICASDQGLDNLVDQAISLTLKGEEEETLEKARELLKDNGIVTMNLGNGFAITHGRMDGINDINLGIMLFSNPVDYKEVEAFKVLFCILVPHSKNRRYLSLLAHISRLFQHDEAKEIFNCENAHKIVEFINKFEEDN